MSAHFTSATLAVTDHFRAEVIVGEAHYLVRHGAYSYRGSNAPVATFQSESAAIRAAKRLAGRFARLTGQASFKVILRAVYNDAGVDCGSITLPFEALGETYTGPYLPELA